MRCFSHNYSDATVTVTVDADVDVDVAVFSTAYLTYDSGFPIANTYVNTYKHSYTFNYIQTFSNVR